MSSDSPYSILFEPVSIGPVVARNRFYQVPHCCGMGHLRPRAHAAMRGIKAEGGWAVVSTEEAEIHPSSDISPFPEQRIWDERDLPALRLMVEAVHGHGALAAIELVHNGLHATNLFSRTPPLAPGHIGVDTIHPAQARAMDKNDIRALRGWHKRAVENALKAGFDIIYAYAGHNMSIAHHFLSPRFNQRGDEYGGTLPNRLRLTRELLEDSLEVAAGRCAIALRFAVDDLQQQDGIQAHEEGRAAVELLADLPDLWDVNIAGWDNDSQTSRFAPDEGYQEEYTRFVKQVTRKPVVGVGRYTNPDRMVSLVRDGVLDFIGAARPSIADPFLPAKIEAGRTDEICECIGCNICVASDNLCVPIRCTQNPTMGEEWRRGWHPQRTWASSSDDTVLIVGAGPAGLECACQLGDRGYPVVLAEAEEHLGGRVLLESRLKGLAAWLRVRDYREQQLRRCANVAIYRDNRLGAADIASFDCAHVMVATGSQWRRDGVGRSQRRALDLTAVERVLTPDDIMRGTAPGAGPVLIYDDDQGYMGGVIADHVSAEHDDVTLLTPAGIVSPWTVHTLEQPRIQAGLIHQGVKILTSRKIQSTAEGTLRSVCVFSGRSEEIVCTTLILVTERSPATALTEALRQQLAASPDSSIEGITPIGDCLAPALIADAVFAGHLAARNFQRAAEDIDRELLQRELPAV